MGDRSGIMGPDMLTAGRTIAGTPLDVAKCKAEFTGRTGGSSGKTWVHPLLERDIVPPHELCWPEHVTTPRGDE